MLTWLKDSGRKLCSGERSRSISLPGLAWLPPERAVRTLGKHQIKYRTSVGRSASWGKCQSFAYFLSSHSLNFDTFPALYFIPVCSHGGGGRMEEQESLTFGMLKSCWPWVGGMCAHGWVTCVCVCVCVWFPALLTAGAQKGREEGGPMTLSHIPYWRPEAI